jgi:thymidylate synthase (FAD)
MILVKPSFDICTDLDGDAILKRIERAGRTCYKSEDKITRDSAKKFVESLIKRGHESVIEHESITVRLIVDRGVSHELVRHRIASYSQESTRYCNYKGGVTFVIPPWVTIESGVYTAGLRGGGGGALFRGGKEIDFNRFSPSEREWFDAVWMARIYYTKLIDFGGTPQQARSVLPNSLKTEIVITANLREWRHIFRLRCSPTAHPQMQEIMIPLLAEFQKQIPVVFDDIHVE